MYNDFDAIADTWWHDSMHMLHKLNTVRSNYIISKLLEIDSKLDNFNALDAGCGGGLLTESLYKAGLRNIVGIDSSEVGINVAIKHSVDGSLPIEYHCSTIQNWLISDNQYDVIMLMEILEHVDNPIECILQCHANLKPGGIMFIATINRTIKSMILIKMFSEYVMRYIPIGTHKWDKFLRPSELVMPLLDAGMNVIEMVGCKYSVLRSSFDLVDDLDMNYMIYLRKK